MKRFATLLTVAAICSIVGLTVLTGDTATAADRGSHHGGAHFGGHGGSHHGGHGGSHFGGHGGHDRHYGHSAHHRYGYGHHGYPSRYHQGSHGYHSYRAPYHVPYRYQYRHPGHGYWRYPPYSGGGVGIYGPRGGISIGW